MTVTQKEIVEALLEAEQCPLSAAHLAYRIQSEGIAPPDGYTIVPVATTEFSWECLECGSQEYTMSVSEDDVEDLGCGNCGSSDWIKKVTKPC